MTLSCRVNVRVEFTSSPTGAKLMSVSVADTGPGIAPESLPDLLGRMYNTSKSDGVDGNTAGKYGCDDCE